MIAILLIVGALGARPFDRPQALPAPTEDEPRMEVPCDASDLRVGHWVEVRGRLEGPDRFVAEKVEILEAERFEMLLGTVTAHDVGEGDAMVLGQPVSITEKTEWTDMEPTDLTGSRVRIQGYFRDPGKLSARDVRSRGEGRDRIAGRVDAISGGGERVVLDVMRWKVECGPGTEFESAGDPGSLTLVDKRWDLPRQLASVDEDDLIEERFEVAPGVRIGGQIELESEREDDFDLDPEDDEDRWDNQAVARLRVAWKLTEDWYVRTEGRFRMRWREDAEDGFSRDDEAKLGETWLYWRNAFGEGTDLQIGRQDFDDEREWIYDEDLDGIRVVRFGAGLRGELAISTTWGPDDSRDRNALNLTGYLSNLDEDRHLAAWFVHRDFESGQDGYMTHLGARALGDWVGPLNVWLDASAAFGQESGRDVFGHAYDLGFTWRPDGSPVSLSAGLAWASGDDGNGTDGAYRQTGLQDNNGKLGTATSIRYYGELVDPELSNLRIATLAASWWIGEDTTLALIGHDFAQVEAAGFLRDAEIDDPDAGGKHIGRELDLVLGSRAIENVDLEFVAGVFFPGDAYTSDDPANFLRLQVRYRF